jgi:predicted XRE-type DNA-binding protein
MKPELRKKPAAAGWTTGDAADFFGLSDEQRQLLDPRVAIATIIRRECKAQNITQKHLAMRLHLTQPRVAKIEAAAPDVSFDQMLRALSTGPWLGVTF